MGNYYDPAVSMVLRTKLVTVFWWVWLCAMTMTLTACSVGGEMAAVACAAGEMALDESGCQPAGVPPQACGAGYVPDGKQGCDVVLPVEACPDGMMAVPGEPECHDVAPCGNSDYGDIPIEPGTQFVNAAYQGENGPSDGTQERPWTVIQLGVSGAEPGAIVAVAAGTYAESVLVQQQPVRIWGRCPGLVHITGDGTGQGAIRIFGPEASTSEVRRMAVSSSGMGIHVLGASDVIVEQVRVHDTGDNGISVGVYAAPLDTMVPPVSTTIRHSLIERGGRFSIGVGGASVAIEATVVRDAKLTLDLSIAVGIFEQNGGRSHVNIRASVVENNYESITVRGSDVVIENTVVRHNTWGIFVADGSAAQPRSNMTMRGSIVEQNRTLNVGVIGSSATIETTTLRDAWPNSFDNFGHGIEAIPGNFTRERANLVLRSSVVDSSREVGVIVHGSDAAIDATIVRDTQLNDIGQGGYGILVEKDSETTQERAILSLRGSVVENNRLVGVSIWDSGVHVNSTIVRDTQPLDDGRYGYGVQITSRDDEASITMDAGLLEGNHGAGIFVVRADATVTATTVRDTRVGPGEQFADGIAVLHGTATIMDTTVSSNARAGVSSFGAPVMLVNSVLECNTFEMNGEDADGIPFSFDGSHDNVCGCYPEMKECKVSSSMLKPPPPIEPG